MDFLIQSYVKGNIATAKAQAKRFACYEIREALIETLGYSLHKATLTADWLKGRDCFQAACDAP